MVKGSSRRFYLPFSANVTRPGSACRRVSPAQLSDDPWDTFVAVAHQHRPQLSYWIPSIPNYLTPLLAWTLTRVYLAVVPVEAQPNEAGSLPQERPPG